MSAYGNDASDSTRDNASGDISGTHEEVDCRQVLEDVYVFLDNECDDHERAKIKNHLDECYPCLQKFGIEQEVKHILATKCGGDKAPTSLRQTLRVRLSEIIIDEPA